MMTLQLPDGSEHNIDKDDDVQRIIVRYLWEQGLLSLAEIHGPTIPNGKIVVSKDKSDIEDKKRAEVGGTGLWIGCTQRLSWALNRMNVLIEYCGQKPENYRLSLGRLGSGEEIG